jgi:hypothetical protein
MAVRGGGGGGGIAAARDQQINGGSADGAPIELGFQGLGWRWWENSDELL